MSGAPDASCSLGPSADAAVGGGVSMSAFSPTARADSQLAESPPVMESPNRPPEHTLFGVLGVFETSPGQATTPSGSARRVLATPNKASEDNSPAAAAFSPGAVQKLCRDVSDIPVVPVEATTAVPQRYDVVVAAENQVQVVDTDEELEALLASGQSVVVDWSASWCAPCPPQLNFLRRCPAELRSW